MYSLFKVIFGRNYKKSFVGTPEGFFAYHSWMKDLKNAQVMKKKKYKGLPSFNYFRFEPSSVLKRRSQLKPLLQFTQCASVVAYFELVT